MAAEQLVVRGHAPLDEFGERSEEHSQSFLRLRMSERRMQAREIGMAQDVDLTISASSSTFFGPRVAAPIRKHRSGAFVRSPLSCAARLASSSSVLTSASLSSNALRGTPARSASASARRESQSSIGVILGSALRKPLGERV